MTHDPPTATAAPGSAGAPGYPAERAAGPDPVGTDDLRVAADATLVPTGMRAVDGEGLAAHLRAAEGLTLVYLWGPDCPNCVAFKRAWPQIAASIAGLGVHLLACDVYAHTDVAHAHGLYGVPAFALYAGARRLGLMRAFHGTAYFVAVVREQVAAAAASRAPA